MANWTNFNFLAEVGCPQRRFEKPPGLYGGCTLGGRRSIILAMQEVLSKTDDPSPPCTIRNSTSCGSTILTPSVTLFSVYA